MIRYSEVYAVQRQFPIAHNFVRGEIYLDDEYKRFHLSRCPDKFESEENLGLHRELFSYPYQDPRRKHINKLNNDWVR